jgi:hypothetical protein
MSRKSYQEKLDSIEKQLNELFFFSTEEIVESMQRIRRFPEKGLDVFLDFLKEAREEQNKFFAETIKRNPEFVKAFSRFLNQTTIHIKNEFETKEQKSAEKILKEIS